MFLALFGDDDDTDAESDEREGGERSVPSPLDLSVRIGRGGTESERVHALADVEDQTQQIEAEREN